MLDLEMMRYTLYVVWIRKVYDRSLLRYHWYFEILDYQLTQFILLLSILKSNRQEEWNAIVEYLKSELDLLTW